MGDLAVVWRRAALGLAAVVATLAFGTGAVMHHLHLSGAPWDTTEVIHWLRDGALGLVPASLVVALAFLAMRRLVDGAPASTSILTWALLVGGLHALSLIPGAVVHGILEGHAFELTHVVRDASAALPYSTGLTFVIAVVMGVPGLTAPLSLPRGVMRSRRSTWSARSTGGLVPRTAVVVLSFALALAIPPLDGVTGTAAPAEAAAPVAQPCDDSAVDRDYSVVAVNVILPFNRWGDVDRHGQIFVLEDDRQATTHWMYPLDHADLGGADDGRRLRPRPLVLRANEGECVRVEFKNDLEEEAPIPSDDSLRDAARPNPPLSGDNEGLPVGDQYASIHVHGAAFDVKTSDGGNVGFNDDTTVGTADGSDTITYYWRAPAKEGLFFFHDHATVAGSEADAGSNSHGLWGALAVEPPGSTWHDPVSGAPLYSPSNADPDGSPIANLNPGGPSDTSVVSGDLYLDTIITPAAGTSFREAIQISQDEIPGDHLQNCDLRIVAGFISSRAECTDPEPEVNAAGDVLAGFEFGLGLGFNFGVEPLLIRQEPINRCPDCVGEETWLSSWPYGDPGLVKLASGLGPWYPSWHPLYDGNGGEQNHANTSDPEDCGLEARSPLLGNSCYTANVVHAYQFDAAKVRFLHAGPKETHIFHMHAHQWLSDPFDTGAVPEALGSDWPAQSGIDEDLPEAVTIDSQTFGPGEGFTADLLFGAGSRPGTIGDSIFHCHLYPHFAEGFWSLFRTHDVIEDGTGVTPDGVGVRNLTALPDDATPTEQLPTAQKPGYPRFVPGEYGWRAPQPIGSVWEPNGAADDAATSLVREDLSLAPRYVAGQVLDLDYLNQIQTVDVSGVSPVDEVQSVSVTADGGTFTLTFDGSTTAAIAYDATALAVETALESLPGLVDVGVAGASGSWTVTFLDPGAQDVPEMSGDSSLLTSGGGAGSVAVATVSDGDDGGSYALTYRGETTAPIPWDANPESALEALSGVTDVTVTGSPASWQVTFVSPSLNIPMLAADDSGLSTGSVTVGSAMSDPAHSQARLIAALTAEDENTGGSTRGTTTSVEGEILEADRNDEVIPGAPVVDPCPTGARQVTYDVSVIQTDVVYNEAGWHDTQGRYYVLTKDVPAILAGEMEPVPFFFRANPGDCLNFNLTNLLPNYLGNDDFLELIQTNMIGQHIHLVKFDVMASDGASNGWNYQQAAYSEDQMLFNQSLRDGTPLDATFSAVGRTGEFDHYPAGAAATCGTDGFDGLHIEENFSAGVLTANGNGCRIADPEWFNPTWACGAQCPVGQTIRERWYVDYDLKTVFTHDHHFPAEDQNRGLFAALVVEPSGMDVRDPFTGEYFQPINDPAHGPICATPLVGADVDLRAAQGLPTPGTGCVADADGIVLDIIGPAPADDFREYSVAVADFVSLYRDCQPGGEPCSSFIPGQEPIAPPDEPELYPDDDPGIFALNYRNAPLVLRDTHNGAPVDPAYWFSSRVHGDPETTLFQAYAGDPVRYRVIQGSQEEQHVIQVHGMRWLDEPDDPGSPLVNSESIGISEAFNFVIPQMPCGVGEDCVGDYLYSTTSTDDLWLGAWGIMRVFGKGVQGLLPLPDNVPQAVNGNTNFAQSGTPPPKANKPGDPCPGTAFARQFDVIAVDAEITYNEFGDHDPYGLVYAVVLPGETPQDAAARMRAGNPSPMVLHVSEGDCVEVTLHNLIDPSGAFAAQHGPVGAQQSGNGFDPPLVLEGPDGTPAGLRVSLHAALLQYDVRGSDGAVIGFNRDQTVGPGESILYRWWADDVTPGELGAVNLTDYGDVRGHRHHGLFAGLVVHPAGATVHDPLTGQGIYQAALAAKAEAAQALADGDPDEHYRLMSVAAQAASGEQVDVRIPGREDYRNWSVFFQDGLNLWDSNGDNLPDQLDHGALPDAEDRGEKGFNYRNASFHNRFGQQAGQPHDALPGEAHRDVFDSTVHGDPATPIFRAYQGDAVRVRVLQGADKPRQHSFMVSGHAWYRQPFDAAADTELIGTVSGISVGKALNIHLTAGGDVGSIGDHRYNCGVSGHHQSGGLWGIARIYAPPVLPASGAFVPSPLGSGPGVADGDNPFRAGYSPVMPLELVEVTASAWDDSDVDGSYDEGEPALGSSGNGDPTIEGIEFQIHEIGGDGTPGAPIGAPAMTAANGSVSFSVVPGAYTVKAVVPEDWRATTDDWFGADASTQANVPSGQVGLVQLADVAIGVYSDIDNDATLDPTESRLEGWTVTLSGAGGEWTSVTGDGSGGSTFGVAAFDGLDPGTYSVSVTPMAGRENSTVLPFDIEVAENASLGGPADPIDVGFFAPSGFRVHLFNDADGDGQQDAPESNKSGWSVTITPSVGGAPIELTTGSDGVADFGDVDPGAYDIVVAYPADWSLATWSSERLLTNLGDGSVDDESAVLPVTCAAGTCAFTVHGPEMSGGAIVGTRAHLVTLGVQNPNVTVVADPFNDFGNDGVRDSRDRKLVGWTAELIHAGTVVATQQTANDGKAVFYLDPAGFAGGPVSPGSSLDFTVRFHEPVDAEIPWAPTPANASTPTGSGLSGVVSVIAGESVTAQRGFIRLGTLEVSVYHDLDGNATSDGYDPPLAGQTVRLRSRNGKTVLATKVSDSSGTVAFPVSAGADYQVEIVVPGGWVQTSPLGSNGTPAQRVKVTTASSPTESTQGPEFGLWQSVDTTPPPVPTFNPAGGTAAVPVEVESGTSITISSEAGATIWYTTDGSTPDPTTGTGSAVASPAAVLLGSVGPVTLRAVAVDGSGNVSTVATAYYDVTAGGGVGGETRTVAPTTWTVLKGSLIAGGPSSLASDNGLEGGSGYLQMGSTRLGKNQVIWAEGTAFAQTGGVTSLVVTWDAIASTGGVTRKLLIWDFDSSAWVEVDTMSNEGTSTSPPMVFTLANPDRFVADGNGEIRFRVETRQKSGHELWVDQLVATVTTGP